jgi:hypothetical protein
MAKKEAVNHPSHYHAASGVEVIDAIEAWDLGFSLGNAVKYIARARPQGHRSRISRRRVGISIAPSPTSEQGKKP